MYYLASNRTQVETEGIRIAILVRRTVTAASYPQIETQTERKGIRIAFLEIGIQVKTEGIWIAFPVRHMDTTIS